MNFKTTPLLYATLAFLLIPAFAFAQPPNDFCVGAIPATFINPQGTGCGAPTTLAFTTDGTTDSGVPNVCSTPGNDQWFTWTATSPSLFFDSEDPGQPGMAVFANCAEAAAGNDITCAVSHASATLSGWNVGDNLIIQIYDVTGQMSDVAFCLEEFTPPPACGGNFFDSGGPTANYSSSELITTTICPVATGDVVTVTFTAFDTEAGFDFLSVFDGNDNTTPSLGIFSGTTTPGPFTSTAANGCLTFEFDSDGSVTAAGWEADVTCAPPPSCPPVNNVATSNVTDVSVDVTFVAPNGQTLFEALLFAPGADPLTATPLFTTTGPASPISVTGLTPNTSYDVYVRTDCAAAGLGLSTLDGPSSFTTSPAPPACGGNFFDSGGPTANYSSSELITTTICPDVPGDVVTVTFTSFDTEAGFDILSVFDGDNGMFPNLGTFSGTTIPGPFTSSAFSGCLTFVFDSDGFTTAAGWEADVTCTPLVPLPVELASFNAYPATLGNVIEWTAATEIDFYMYTVERAIDPANFSAFADVAPKGTNFAEAVYSTQDLNPTPTTYYRLRMEDLDGAIEYSDVVAVTRDDISGGIKMFPNPAREHVTFEVLAGVTDNGNINVVLTDLNGRQVRVWSLAANESTNVSLSGIPSGVYMVSSVSAAGTASQRLVID